MNIPVASNLAEQRRADSLKVIMGELVATFVAPNDSPRLDGSDFFMFDVRIDSMIAHI